MREKGERKGTSKLVAKCNVEPKRMVLIFFPRMWVKTRESQLTDFDLRRRERRRSLNMVTSVVDRATSNMLMGADWAMNLEICDMLNRDPGQVKGVVKGIKIRIGNKNPKVQLLALTLLETIVKNCGDIVHMQVAEKGLPRDMVKIYKKKPDYQVKEKVLTLIDTWQEAFGGPRARYPQYFAAYQDLLHAGAIFPQRSGRAPPVFTPPQSRPLSSYPQNMQYSEFNQEGARAGSSTEAEFPTLSLSEIQKVRGIVEVLSDMLNAISPGNKEALMQEALLDLVEQCRTYKQRAVHLVNSTADESLLCQGLPLNDELERVLAKHERVVAEVSVQPEKPITEPAPQACANVESPAVDAGESSQLSNGRHTSEANALTQSSFSAQPGANGTTTLKADSEMDLLSGDDFSSPTQNSLALVPVSAPQPPSPVASEQNALALVDLFSVGSNASNPPYGHLAVTPGSEFQQQQQQQHLHPQQTALYQNERGAQSVQMLQQPSSQIYQTGITPHMGSPLYQSGHPQVSSPSWGAQSVQLQQQPSSALYQNGISPHMGLPHDQSGHAQVSSPSWSAQSLQLQQQPSSPPHQNGAISNMGSPHEQSGSPSWLAQSVQLQQQPSSPVHAAQNGGALPPPPWESQSTDIQLFGTTFSPSMQISTMGSPQSPRVQTLGLPAPGNDQIVGMFVQPITGGQLMALNQSFQMPNIYTQHPQGSQIMNMLPQAMQATHMTSMYPQQMHNIQMAGYGYGGYGQQKDAQYLEQKMYALSVKDDTSLMSSASSQMSVAAFLPPIKQQPMEGEKLFGDLLDMAPMPPVKQQAMEGNKLFGDLLDMAKLKAAKTPSGRIESIDI